MFTGIVTECGRVRQITPTERGVRLEIDAPGTVRDARIGDSVAVNGVCLTATSVTEHGFTCEVVQETIERSTLGDVVPDTLVNLERPMPANGRFDGHIVQGHVDGVGTVAVIVPEGDARRVRVELPPRLAPYTVEKGSIALDGTSLTLTQVSPPLSDPAWVEVVLIPHTLESTVLGGRVVGDRVNVEVDILAKYLERRMEMKP